MMNKETLQKTKDVESAFDLLLNSIDSVNDVVMSLSSEEFKKGNLEKRKEYNEKSDHLAFFRQNLLVLKNNWDDLFGGKAKNDAKVDNHISVLNENITSISSVEHSPVEKKGYKCTNKDITLIFANAAGRPYQIKIPKVVFKEIITCAVKCIQRNGEVQSKDIVAELGQYIIDNTNYKDSRSIVGKTLKFLLESPKLLKYKDGRTGYYELSGTANDVFVFLNNFDKPDNF